MTPEPTSGLRDTWRAFVKAARSNLSAGAPSSPSPVRFRREVEMTDSAVTDKSGMFVHGVRLGTDGRDLIPVRNPADNEVISEVANATREDVERAVEDGLAACRTWQRVTPAERGRILTRIALALRERNEEFARLETLDNGKPISAARSDVEGSARYFEFFAGAADKINGDEIPLGPDYLAYSAQVPIGLIAQILPWNAPLQQAARGLAPALAAGNCVVVKPAEDTPLSALALAELAVRCGLPPGVLNVVTGYGEEAGAWLSEHPAVRKVVFTGSVPTGRIVNLSAARRLVPVTLELGGKSANIVFSDADLDLAIKGAAKAINANSGQNCSAGSRLLLHESIHDEFVERLAAHNARLTIGPGLADPDLGPITTREQFDRVRDYLAVGEQEGATPITGGVAVEGRSESGYFVPPTIFTGVRNTMRIAREEIFGPVVSAIRFSDEEEALEIANDSDFGLVAGIWSQNISRVHRVAPRLEVGQVYVNEYYAGYPGGVETPFGGTKNSGIGREKGLEAIKGYTQSRTVVIKL
jgi:aldehyde dehydrogenase (NAD+)